MFEKNNLEAFLLKTPNWKLAGILSIIYFPIITILSTVTQTNYIIRIISSICTTLVFFIWVWFIFSLWKEKVKKKSFG